MHIKPIFIASAVTAAFLFTGCGDTKSTTLQDELAQNSVEKKIAGFAVFNPTEGLLPYPNSILFAPNDSSMNDFDGGKTLNIPYEPTDADANIKRQLNTLTGFSTTSAITAPLSEGTKLDANSMVSGVKMYKVNIDPATGAVTDINATLTFGVDFVATQSGDKIAIVPLKPLEGLTNYMVVLNNSLKDAKGRVLSPDYATALTLSANPVQPGGSITPETAAKLEAIRQANRAMMGAMLKAGIDPTGTVQIWNFRTQMIGATQEFLAASAAMNPTAELVLADTNMTTKMLFSRLIGDAADQIPNNAEIYAGTLSNLPQYMPQGPRSVYSGEFRYKEGSLFEPELNTTVTIPVVATLPSGDSNCSMPADGWPVVIYQHGITRSRTDLFLFGATLASRCYAGVAIDLPLHGENNVTFPDNPFFMPSIERTFNVDFVTEDPYGDKIVSYEPDGKIDSSGAHFMNLTNILTTRDNLMQVTSDLTELVYAVGSVRGARLDGNHVAFLSHSLGNIASIGFLKHTGALESAVLMMPGQQLIPLLTHSDVFAPAINAGLASHGIMPDTPEYAAFMLASQTLIDDADPANYTPAIGQKTLPILEFEALSDVNGSGGDRHIPNRVATDPLAGTDPFILFTQAKDINVSGKAPGDLVFPTTAHTATRLTVGEHRSPLLPAYGESAYFEYHSELISFISSKGAAIKITDPSIIKQ